MNINNISQDNKLINTSYINGEAIKDNFTNSNDVDSTKRYEVQADKYNEKDLAESIKKMNKLLEGEKVHVEYSVHEELHSLMIKIVEDESKKVILEMPSGKILDMIACMCKQDGLLDEKA